MVRKLTNGDKMKVLILCTGNSCRSQMAEGFLKHLYPDWEVFSAGTKPAEAVNRFAVKVMAEKGIDISTHTPYLVDKYINESFDYVVTVCDNAKTNCPVFIGSVKNRVHIGFEDPADAVGTDDEVIPVYRKVRDQIFEQFQDFFSKI